MILDFTQAIDFENLKPQDKGEEKIVLFLKNWFSDAKTLPVQTSGSTGRPKIFEIEKQKMFHSARMTCDFLDLKKGNTALLCLPIDYISGKMMVVRAIERQLGLHTETPSAKPLDKLNQKIDFAAMSPLQVQYSLDKMDAIQNLIIGGAAVSENLKNKINEKSRFHNHKFKIYETYGMSETLSHIALKQISPMPETFFTLLEGVEISVDDRNCLRVFAPPIKC